MKKPLRRVGHLEEIFWGFFRFHAQVYTKLPHDPVLTQRAARELFYRGIDIGKGILNLERRKCR